MIVIFIIELTFTFFDVILCSYNNEGFSFIGVSNENTFLFK